MRNIRTNNKKRLISTILCSLFVLQQSLVYPAMASVIQDGAGNDIGKHPYTGNYEIRPDLYNYYNGKVGFKEFQKLQLSEGDVLNFIFQAYNGSVPESQYWDIDTFVNFVNSQVNIQGIVNALTDVGGEL